MTGCVLHMHPEIASVSKPSLDTCTSGEGSNPPHADFAGMATWGEWEVLQYAFQRFMSRIWEGGNQWQIEGRLIYVIRYRFSVQRREDNEIA